MTGLNHLDPGVRALAGEDSETRIASLRRDRWIDYPRAREALSRLEWMLASPRKTRMPGMLIYGDSNIGKSMIVSKFTRMQSKESDKKPANAIGPVISIQMPAAPQERRLYAQLLMALNLPYRSGDTLSAIESRSLLALDEAKPRMLIVDEVHNLLAGSSREQRASLNLLKFLSNRLRCALVVLGTRDALAATQSDEQIASRLPGYELRRWSPNEQLRSFLAGFERQLPLRSASSIADSPLIVNSLVEASAGLTGRLCGLITQAATIAINSEQEKITPELIETVIAHNR